MAAVENEVKEIKQHDPDHHKKILQKLKKPKRNGALHQSSATEGQASDLFCRPSMSKVLGNIISEPEHKPLA